MKKRHFLVVDDEETIRLTVSRDLTKSGYEVTTAENGIQAIEKLEKFPFDVIITDLNMDGADGIQVLKKAREMDTDAMVIILTGFASLATALDAVKFGAYDYLLKPCNREELFLRVARCLEKLELKEKLKRYLMELETANEKLVRLSSLDGLTGISNRRVFDEQLERGWSLAMRSSSLAISLLFIDVDYFKWFNDAYGHQAGDDCLIKIAGTISGCLKRPTDLAARYGGEEFVALLLGTNKDYAVKLAEEIRHRVMALGIPHEPSLAGSHVTISIGVATMIPERTQASSALVALADAALYKAKQNGRNRVES